MFSQGKINKVKIEVRGKLKEQARIVRVSAWDEFKRLLTALRPTSIAYTFEKSPLSTPPVALRLAFGSEGAQYVFLDFAQGEDLKRTKIPVHLNRAGEPYLKDEEVKNFILTQLNRTDLSIVSFGVLGY